jgi:uncharacterized protein YpuA (DUF1002 family)
MKPPKSSESTGSNTPSPKRGVSPPPHPSTLTEDDYDSYLKTLITQHLNKRKSYYGNQLCKEGKPSQREVIREILMKVKQDDGGFDFSRFKVLYSNHYINDEL